MALIQSIIGLLSSPLLLEFLKQLSSALGLLGTLISSVPHAPKAFVTQAL